MNSPTPCSQRPRTWSLILMSASPLLLLAACASAPAELNQKIAVAEASVAHASNASTQESAALELQIAVNKLDSARQAMTNRDYERAQMLAEEAEVDAQVAELHAQSVRSRKAAEESRAAAQALRNEIDRRPLR